MSYRNNHKIIIVLIKSVWLFSQDPNIKKEIWRARTEAGQRPVINCDGSWAGRQSDSGDVHTMSTRISLLVLAFSVVFIMIISHTQKTRARTGKFSINFWLINLSLQYLLTMMSWVGNLDKMIQEKLYHWCFSEVQRREWERELVWSITDAITTLCLALGSFQELWGWLLYPTNL